MAIVLRPKETTGEMAPRPGPLTLQYKPDNRVPERTRNQYFQYSILFTIDYFTIINSPKPLIKNGIKTIFLA